MSYIPKTSRYEHLVKILAIIISLYDESKLLAQIGNQLNLLRSTIATIIHHRNKQPDQLL